MFFDENNFHIRKNISKYVSSDLVRAIYGSCDDSVFSYLLFWIFVCLHFYSILPTVLLTYGISKFV